jgi:upstream activation factor subunit UAF30
VADEDDDEDDDEDEDGSDFEAPKKRKAKRRSKQTGDGERSANGGFNKKLPVSKELEAWIGKSEISRPELTSFFWQYVKEHGLQVMPTSFGGPERTKGCLFKKMNSSFS